MPLQASGEGGPSGNSRGVAHPGGGIQNIQSGMGAISIGDRESALLAQSQYDNIGHHHHHHPSNTPQGFHR